jgi:NAD(P)-dependent dehydrogenase (short-subunit alcohol dehydrogenase family)
VVLVAPVSVRWMDGVAWYHNVGVLPVLGPLFAHTLALPTGLLMLNAGARGAFLPQTMPDGYVSSTRLSLLLRPGEFLANAHDMVALKEAVTAQSARYSEIKVPVIVLHGDVDKSVYLTTHSQPFAKSVPQTELIVLPGIGHLVPNAATDEVIAAVDRLLPQAAAALGPIGVLVNNASVFENDTVATVTRASWDRHLDTNLRAPFLLMQRFAEQLPAGRNGVVVNLLDQRVWSLTPYFVSYTVSKVGLWALTQSMALALAPRIRVAGIGPGPTLPSPRQTPEQFERQCREMPLQRGTSPEEIAAAVRFILASPALTGQMIALDGGQHLGWAQPSAQRPPPEE